MMRQWLVAMLGVAVMALPAAASAQQTAAGWYMGADLGQADFGSDEDMGLKFLGGYQMNRNFAVEAGYGWLFDKNNSEVTALELLAVGILPLQSGLSLFGKIGLAKVDFETGGGSRDETELTFGLGLQFDLSPKFGLRGQWQRYDTDREIDLLSIGVIYRF